METPPKTLREALLLTGGGVISLVGAGGKTSLMFRLARELSDGGETVLTTTTTKIMRPDSRQSPAVILSASSVELIEKSRKYLTKNYHITAAYKEKDEGKLVGFLPEVIDEINRTSVFRWIIVEADGASRMPLKAPAEHEPVIPRSTRWVIGVAGLDAVGQPLAVPHVFRPDRYARICGIPLGDPVTESSVAHVLAAERGIMKGRPPHAAALAFLNKADTPQRVEIGKAISGFLGRRYGGVIRRVVIGTALGRTPVALWTEP